LKWDEDLFWSNSKNQNLNSWGCWISIRIDVTINHSRISSDANIFSHVLSLRYAIGLCSSSKNACMSSIQLYQIYFKAWVRMPRTSFSW
jgi:hypothetical protein